MLQNKKDSCFIDPILERLEPTKINKFTCDVTTIFNIISDKIYKADYNVEVIPESYNRFLKQRKLLYELDILMCLYLPEVISDD